MLSYLMNNRQRLLDFLLGFCFPWQPSTAYITPSSECCIIFWLIGIFCNFSMLSLKTGIFFSPYRKFLLPVFAILLFQCQVATALIDSFFFSLLLIMGILPLLKFGLVHTNPILNQVFLYSNLRPKLLGFHSLRRKPCLSFLMIFRPPVLPF